MGRLAAYAPYTAKYERAALQRYAKKRAVFAGENIRRPIRLTALDSSALMRSHASVFPVMPEYYGCYRDLNLKRGDTVFIQHSELGLVIDILLALAKAHRPTDLHDAVKFAARLFSDFLAAHPFIDANQRMAMLIVSKYFEPWNLNITWGKINSSQYYYWMRCATRGHIGFLENGFLANIVAI